MCESAQTLLILRCNLCVFFFFFLQKEKKNMKMVLMGRGTYIERIVREREREWGPWGMTRIGWEAWARECVAA